MKLTFNVHSAGTEQMIQAVDVQVRAGIVAGWAGRDLDAIEEHIQELAELGVPRPSAVPLYYRIAGNQFIQDDTIEVVGDETSGEAEVLVFTHEGETLVSLASDHTDRKLETHSVALSKQICAKPVARDAWRMSDVADHWDALILRAWIMEDGQQVLYQDGTLASLRTPDELINGLYGSTALPAGHVMTCGTVNAIGGIRPAPEFVMELHDPVLNRTIGHRYAIAVLPEIA